MSRHDKIEYEPDLSAEAPRGAKAEAKLKKIKDKLKTCEKERAEYLAGWQRAKADLINYKKEQERRNSALFKFANENLILEILPVLDSFEEAMKHSKDEGIKQLYNQLKNILKSNGLEEIESVGKKFDPEFHQSVGEIHPERSRGKNSTKEIVAEEVQKGYKLNNKVIRPSRVKISK